MRMNGTLPLRTKQHEAVVGALQSLGCWGEGTPPKGSHGQGRDQNWGHSRCADRGTAPSNQGRNW